MAGKGDAYRPVNKQRFDENFERIFRKEELHAPAQQTTPDGYCTCTGRDCIKAQSAPAAETPSSPSPNTGEDILGCDAVFKERW
jgi:hypothetical protein